MKTEHKVIIIVLLIVAILYFFSNKSENLDPLSPPPSISNEAIQMFNNAYKDTTGIGRFNNIITMGNIKTTSLNVGKDANGNYISSIDEAGNIITSGNIKSGGSLEVSGNAKAGSLDISNNIKSGSLDVSGNVNFGNINTKNIISSGNIKIDASGNISTTGNIIANNIPTRPANNAYRFVEFGFENNNAWQGFSKIKIFDKNGTDVALGKVDSIFRVRGSSLAWNRQLPRTLVDNTPDSFYTLEDINDAYHMLRIDLGSIIEIRSIQLIARSGFEERTSWAIIKLFVRNPQLQVIPNLLISTGLWTKGVGSKIIPLTSPSIDPTISYDSY